MGTDCVGFVYHCVYEATKDYDVISMGQKVKGTRMRFRPTGTGLGNISNWKATGLFPNAKSIDDKSQPPKPGDILIWSKNDETGHVGMAVRIDRNTIGVAHSTGQMERPYTCKEYASYGSEDVAWVGYPSERSYSGENGVNGFVVHEYNNYINHFAPGTRDGKQIEDYRVRLEETEDEPYYDDVIEKKLNGTWKPVDVNAYVTQYNAYGLPVYQNSSKFVEYNPDDPENSSSLMITISVDKQIPETNYQSLKPEYLISADGQVVFASLANEASRSNGVPPGASGFFHEGSSGGSELYQESRIDDIFYYDLQSRFHVSGDVLVSKNDVGCGDDEERIVTISFPDSSKMKIVNSFRGGGNTHTYYDDSNYEVSADLVIELERTDGEEDPEPDEWLEKLSGTWEPVEYKRIDGNTNTDMGFTFVPYDPNNEDSSSSPQITLAPYKECYWYRPNRDRPDRYGYRDGLRIVAVDDNGDYVHTIVFPAIVNYPYEYMLEVSGDALIGNAYYDGYDVRIEFPDEDTMTVENYFDGEGSDPYREYFKLTRKK